MTTPVFDIHPRDEVGLPAETIELFVIVSTDASATTFQWALDGTDIANGSSYSGVTTNVLTITVAQSLAGDYTCTATNAGDSATSNAGTLTVPCADAATVYTKTLRNGSPAGYMVSSNSLYQSNPNNNSNTTDYIAGNQHRPYSWLDNSSDRANFILAMGAIVGSKSTALDDATSELINTYATILRARIRIRNYSEASSPSIINLYTLLTADADFVSSQMTWNISKTGTNWNTSGAMGSGTDHSASVASSYWLHDNSLGLRNHTLPTLHHTGLISTAWALVGDRYIDIDVTADVQTYFASGQTSDRLAWVWKSEDYTDSIEGLYDNGTYSWVGHLSDNVSPSSSFQAQYRPQIIIDYAFIDGDGNDIDVPDEGNWWDATCTEQWTEEEQGTSVSPDFNRVMVLDLNHNAVFPGYGFPITCALHVGSPCAPEGYLPTNVYGIDTSARPCRIFNELSYGLGPPMSLRDWTLTGNCTTTVLEISPGVEENFFPVDHLIGLTARVIYADGSTETGTITDNDNNTITLSSALSGGAPASGDTLQIGPMPCGVLMAETRFLFPAVLRSLLVNARSRQNQTQDFMLDIYGASGANTTLNLAAALATKNFDVTDFRVGTGRIFPPAVSSAALAYALRFWNMAGGPLDIEHFTVEEIVNESEQVRQ